MWSKHSLYLWERLPCGARYHHVVPGKTTSIALEVGQGPEPRHGTGECQARLEMKTGWLAHLWAAYLLKAKDGSWPLRNWVCPHIPHPKTPPRNECILAIACWVRGDTDLSKRRGGIVFTIRPIFHDSWGWGLLLGIVFALQRGYFGLLPADSVPSARAPYCRSRHPWHSRGRREEEWNTLRAWDIPPMLWASQEPNLEAVTACLRPERAVSHLRQNHACQSMDRTALSIPQISFGFL